MSTNSSLLKPKVSTKPTTLEYVWYSDPNAIIVDLSGTPATKLNANDPKNGLTKNDELGYWTNASGQIYRNDVSGNDISGALLQHAFYVADSTGLKSLTRVNRNAILTESNYSQYTFPIPVLGNALFNDQNGNPYYSSYKTNYPFASANANTDISWSSLITNSSPNGTFGLDVSSNFADISNSKIMIDCSNFEINRDASYNNIQIDVSFNIRPMFPANSRIFVCNMDVSNQLVIKLNKFGFDLSSNVSNQFASYVDQVVNFDLLVNALSANGIIKVDNSSNGLIANMNNILQPNIDLAACIKEIKLSKGGRQNVSVPLNIPANSSGMWVWTLTLIDGNLQSTPLYLTLNVNPTFNEPTVGTVASQTNGYANNLYNNDYSRVKVSLNSSDYTFDISNNVPGGLKFATRINATDSNVCTFDNSFNDISSCISIRVNGGANQINNVIDLSTNKLTFADVSNNNTALVLTAQDLSLDQSTGLWYKIRDVSANIDISYSDNLNHRLPSRNYSVHLDWLSNGEPNAESVIKTQTVKIGDFKFNTTYTSNVQIVDNQDSTYSLSLSDYNGDLAGARYRVRVFSDEKCSALALDSSLNLTSQANVITDTTTNQFLVTMDDNQNASFKGPSVIGPNTFYMVGYLDISNGSGATTHKYTASAPMKFINAKFPTISLSTDATALTAADLNQIIQFNDNLSQNTDLLDLSGYIIASRNVGIDLSFNLALPLWKLSNPVLTFTVNDSNGVVKSFDISGSATKQSKKSVNTAVVFNNLNDISDLATAINNFHIDLSFNTTSPESLFTITTKLSDDSGREYSATNKTILFYSPAAGQAVSNPGNKKNTIIVYNDTKYVLNNVSTITSMGNIGTMDSFNCYSWLSGSSSNSYCLNLARSEFMGENNHILDASSFQITNVSSSGVTNLDTSANLYIGFNNEWAKLITGSVGALPKVLGAGVSGITSAFAKSTYSWIDTKKFIGTIDIKYKTIDGKNNLSTTQNELRLVVLPRPNIVLSVSSSPNVLVNTSSNIQISLRNVQQNTTGSSVTITNWNPSDISGNKQLISKIKTLLTVSSGSLSLVTSAGTPDILNLSAFKLPTLSSDLVYNGTSNAVVVFNGRSVAGNVSSNIRATYNAYGSKAVATTQPVSVNVYSVDSIFNNNVYANNMIVNNSINFIGMPFVQYVALDNSNNSINLVNDSRTKNAAFVYVENKSTLSATVSSLASSISIGPNEVMMFSRSAQNTFEYVYTKQN